jgi:hypothetical protein
VPPYTRRSVSLSLTFSLQSMDHRTRGRALAKVNPEGANAGALFRSANAVVRSGATAAGRPLGGTVLENDMLPSAAAACRPAAAAAIPGKPAPPPPPRVTCIMLATSAI